MVRISMERGAWSKARREVGRDERDEARGKKTEDSFTGLYALSTRHFHISDFEMPNVLFGLGNCRVISRV